MSDRWLTIVSCLRAADGLCCEARRRSGKEEKDGNVPVRMIRVSYRSVEHIRNTKCWRDGWLKLQDDHVKGLAFGNYICFAVRKTKL